jgi:glycine dehydrogenase subunit 1
VSAGLHPHSIQTLRTLAHGYGMSVVEVPLADGVTDAHAWAEAIDGDTSAAIFAQPNFYGAVEDAAALSAAAKSAASEEGKAPVLVAQVDPITLGVLAAPGECGVDVAVGEGQPLGNRLDYGGPSFGLFAAREEYLRRMPGRIAGETLDVDGRRGIVELGELLLARTHYARQTLSALEGVEAMHSQPVIREFALRLAPDVDVAAVKARCARAGVNPGVDIHALTARNADRGGLLVAITEQRTRADIDRLADVLGAAVVAERREAVPA